jgi:hypothetical protein
MSAANRNAAAPSAGRRRRESGSIIIEASLTLPFFLFFILCLVNFIHISIVSMALTNAVSETVRQISAHVYPVALLAEAGEQQEKDGRGEPNQEERLTIHELLARFGEALPPPAGELAARLASSREEWRQGVSDTLWQTFGQELIRPLLLEFADMKVLEEERISIEQIEFPDLPDLADAYFGIEVHYRMPLYFPFIRQSLTLRESAYERLWVGQTTEEAKTDGGGEGIRILSISPAPVRLAKTAVVIAKTAPGGKAHLTVFYKSGESRAKNLGEAVADENGIVSWEWYVSGNTTPGTWRVVATSEDGGWDEQSFEVARRS